MPHVSKLLCKSWIHLSGEGHRYCWDIVFRDTINYYEVSMFPGAMNEYSRAAGIVEVPPYILSHTRYRLIPATY